jgi:anti-sigma regulatory factor (Ser/Thr protein kinase)
VFGIASDASGTVRLEIPASIEYIRMARLVVGALGSQLDFTVDDLEDLAIAVDELCFLLIGPQGWDGTVEISCHVDDGNVFVEGCAPDRGQAIEPSTFSALILGAIASDFDVWREGHEVRFRLVCPLRPAEGRHG